MADLSALIERAQDLAPGEDFALFYLDTDDGIEWSAHACNPTNSVMLGEVGGKFIGQGPSPEDALRDLIRELEAGVGD
ncbi:hypothetical protein [Shimia sp.]|uniref:hypothetical protein n=1 Tax=Shimia sp. TaxID=1954381 RepID=UPI003296C9AA